MSMVYGVTDQPQGLTDQTSQEANDPYRHIAEHDLPAPEQPSERYNPIRTSAQYRTAVIERSPNKHILEQVQIPSSGAIKILSSQKGRKFVLIQCPTGAAASVIVSHNADTLEQATPNGWTLSPGDPALPLPSEDHIYATSGTPGTVTVLNLAQGFYLPDE